MAFGLPDLTKLPQEVQDAIGPTVKTLVDTLNTFEPKVAADAGNLVHASLTEALLDMKALEDPLLARVDAATAVGATLVGLLQQVVDRGVMLVVPKTPVSDVK